MARKVFKAFYIALNVRCVSILLIRAMSNYYYYIIQNTSFCLDSLLSSKLCWLLFYHLLYIWAGGGDGTEKLDKEGKKSYYTMN